jgi:predicted amidohydrolase
MRVAAVQMNSQDDKAANVARAEHWIDEAAAQGADLVALPETFDFCGPPERRAEHAEPIPGPTTERLAAKAREHDLYLHGGSLLEKGGTGGRVFNTSVLINPEGAIIATYRKLHLFDIDVPGRVRYCESRTFQAGEEVVTADTEFGRVGLTICYDLRFPELYRRLAAWRARLIFVPAAFTLHTGKDHWSVLLRARAIENQVYMVAPAQFGAAPPNVLYYGHSMIVDPWGTVLAQASDREGIIVADLDFAFQEQIREVLPCLRHRREDLFPI